MENIQIFITLSLKCKKKEWNKAGIVCFLYRDYLKQGMSYVSVSIKVHFKTQELCCPSEVAEVGSLKSMISLSWFIGYVSSTRHDFPHVGKTLNIIIPTRHGWTLSLILIASQADHCLNSFWVLCYFPIAISYFMTKATYERKYFWTLMVPEVRVHGLSV